ncbi:MAG TPA: class I SAM-dependent methyltransferase [Pseudonocardiaceae bacterium]|jgi:ubiquinone/menaquinone biosynthesis C-methylase UbiE|nr:class I SAM-dependent methyltransferase [Pseudonocardiaceae bacterium]
MAESDVRKFDERAGRYERDWLGTNFHRPVQLATLAIGARLVAAPVAVLDVGCGTGSLLRMAAERFPDAACTGVDPAARMIAVAERTAREAPAGQLRRMGFRCAPAEALPFADREFDLVVSTDSFHNWTDQATGIAEIGRVLVPGGHLVLVDPFAVGWLRAWAGLVGKRDRMRTEPAVRAMLDATGLRCTGWEKILAVGPITMIHAVTAQRIE